MPLKPSCHLGKSGAAQGEFPPLIQHTAASTADPAMCTRSLKCSPAFCSWSYTTMWRLAWTLVDAWRAWTWTSHITCDLPHACRGQTCAAPSNLGRPPTAARWPAHAMYPVSTAADSSYLRVSSAATRGGLASTCHFACSTCQQHTTRRPPLPTCCATLRRRDLACSAVPHP